MEHSNKEYWDERAYKYGHTGWSNEVVYQFDQRIRINVLSKLLVNNVTDINNITLLDFGGDCPKTRNRNPSA